MASIKSIKFYDGNHVNTPNPLKVAFVLEELGLPYEHIIVDFDKIKDEPYISVNPNGKVPAIEDPNSGLTLCEPHR
jgi:glutathione S-transferase